MRWCELLGSGHGWSWSGVILLSAASSRLLWSLNPNMSHYPDPWHFLSSSIPAQVCSPPQAKTSQLIHIKFGSHCHCTFEWKIISLKDTAIMFFFLAEIIQYKIIQCINTKIISSMSAKHVVVEREWVQKFIFKKMFKNKTFPKTFGASVNMQQCCPLVFICFLL